MPLDQHVVSSTTRRRRPRPNYTTNQQHGSVTTLVLWVLLHTLSTNPSQAFTSSYHNDLRKQRNRHGSLSTTPHAKNPIDTMLSDDDVDEPRIEAPKQSSQTDKTHPPMLSRRQAMQSLIMTSTATMALLASSPSNALAATEDAASANSVAEEPLEQLALARGEWAPSSQSPTLSSSSTPSDTVSWADPTFVTYLTRFLIHYDTGVNKWWQQWQTKTALLSPAERDQQLAQKFAALAKSIQQGLTVTLEPPALWDLLYAQYATTTNSNDDDYVDADAPRQLALLFSMLPATLQPTDRLTTYYRKRSTNKKSSNAQLADTATAVTFWESTSADFSALLPPPFHCEPESSNKGFVIVPSPISSSSIANDNLLLTDANNNNSSPQSVETPFGPLGAKPLSRELPRYSSDIYKLFGISGAVGCALTHTVVIPLDVVKTRAQTNPDEQGSNIVAAAVQIVQNEGVDALLLGAQATIAGYFWYGLSVYPSYAFFKRFLTLDVFPSDVALAQANNIALVAGALASVVASLGLTPLEAARIRAVAEPDNYKPLGLLGTLQYIAEEDAIAGWKTLYAGLPSLLTRQVIFGSVKFLAFERACEFIFAFWPNLREFTWTSLAVSLVAGGFSGALSSVVSQPADSLLTFVAQNSDSTANRKDSTDNSASAMGLVEGLQIMIERDGMGSLFRGLGSRSVWAGSIIAGQFLLYDVFRTLFHVAPTDLSQVFQVIVDLD